MDESYILILRVTRIVPPAVTAPGTAFSLTGPTSTVGRHPSVDVIVSDPSISRTHARFHFDGSNVAIENLASEANGTWVGQLRLFPGERRALEGMEGRIQLGGVLMDYHILAETLPVKHAVQPPAPTPSPVELEVIWKGGEPSTFRFNERSLELADRPLAMLCVLAANPGSLVDYPQMLEAMGLEADQQPLLRSVARDLRTAFLGTIHAGAITPEELQVYLQGQIGAPVSPELGELVKKLVRNHSGKGYTLQLHEGDVRDTF